MDTPQNERDEDGRWPSVKCVACDGLTDLRCAGCRAPVCGRHQTCPNGCDNPDSPAYGSFSRYGCSGSC